MTALFSSPKTPAPTILAPPPTVADPAVQQEAAARAAAQAQAAGRASTILTSGQGDPSAASIGRKQLLGQQ